MWSGQKLLSLFAQVKHILYQILQLSIQTLNDDLFGKELFILFTVHVFHERLSICVCVLSLLVLRVGYGI